MKLLKKTKYKINYPKEGLITKTYPLSQEEINLPYIPHSETLKNRKDYSTRKTRKIKKTRKKSTI